jgi:hypothetical protein
VIVGVIGSSTSVPLLMVVVLGMRPLRSCCMAYSVASDGYAGSAAGLAAYMMPVAIVVVGS